MRFREDQWPLLLVQNPDGIGARVELSVNCVLGKAVEISLRLEFRPAVGQLPIPLIYQRAEDLHTFDLADVLKRGDLVAATVGIEVPPEIAAKAIEVARDVVAKMGALGCSICSVDHTASSSSSGVSHDVLMLAAANSSLGEGLQSTEIKLREIKAHPCRYNWFGEMTREAEPLLIAELGTAMGRRLLKGRVLVLVQLASGRAVSGPHKIHVAHCASSQFPVPEDELATWRKVDGWVGFDLQQPVAPPKAAQPAAPPAALPVAPPAAAQPQLSPDAKWDMLLARMPTQGAWLPLPDFLKDVGESALHPKRFLELTGEESEQIWEVGPHNQSATHGIDYKRMGRGGKYYGEVTFLKQVFLKYYERKWQP